MRNIKKSDLVFREEGERRRVSNTVEIGGRAYQFEYNCGTDWVYLTYVELPLTLVAMRRQSLAGLLRRVNNVIGKVGEANFHRVCE